MIFPADYDPAIRNALDQLLKHRREQIGSKHRDYFRELTYCSGESLDDFLARYGAGRGSVDPFFEERLLRVLSNRDRGAAPKLPGASGGGVNEMVIKTLFLSILFDDTRYVTWSELELDQQYADLCLLVRPCGWGLWAYGPRHMTFSVLFAILIDSYYWGQDRR